MRKTISLHLQTLKYIEMSLEKPIYIFKFPFINFTVLHIDQFMAFPLNFYYLLFPLEMLVFPLIFLKVCNVDS